MKDIKKLFKRDYIYWLIMAPVMLGLLAYMTLNILGKYLSEISNTIQSEFEFRDTHIFIPFDIIQEMMIGILCPAIIAQAAKMLTQETKKRAEMQNLLPVKSYNRLTYHYVSGLLIAGIPTLIQVIIIRLNLLFVGKNKDLIFEGGADTLWSYAAKAVIVFMLQYSLLIFCRKLTNHVTGAIFTFVIIAWALQVSAGYYLGMYWNNLADDRIPNWIFRAVVTVVLIIMSYIAEQKKDYAMDGFYAFPVAHWFVMGIVFIGVCYVFHDSYETIPKSVSRLLMIAVALPVTAGVHFITKDSNLKNHSPIH